MPINDVGHLVTEQELDLVNTEVLYEALHRRFDHCTFVGIQVADTDGKVRRRTHYWDGDSDILIGILTVEINHLIDNIKDRVEEDEN